MIARIKDIDIHYEIYGEGTSLFLLHGNGEDSSFFEKQVAFFSDYFRVITPDTRAHGKTNRGSESFNFHTFASDLAGLMNYLMIEKAHFLGFSDGGNTTLHFVLKYPERVLSLTLVGANLFPMGMKFDVLFSVWRDSFRLYCLSLFKKSYQLRKNINDLMLHHPNLTFNEISGIACPALIIAGEKDMIKKSHTKKMAGSIRNSQLNIIPKASHFLLTEIPKVVNPVILTFLQKYSVK